MIYKADFKEGDLLVQLQGESKIFKASTKEELQAALSGLQEEFDLIMYHAEHKENERKRKFFSDLNSTYGYLYTKEDQSLQLFIKIDEALLEGELTGSLLLMSNIDNTYKESTYELYGITDGLMIQLHTIVDWKETKLEGNFNEGDASSFNLSFWTTDQKLLFHTVTEEEFNQHQKQFKSVKR